jgi:hypothetical protein
LCPQVLFAFTTQVELKVKEDEISQIRAEAMRVNKLREQTAKKIKQLEDNKVEVGGWVGLASKVCGEWPPGQQEGEGLEHEGWGGGRCWLSSSSSSQQPRCGCNQQGHQHVLIMQSHVRGNVAWLYQALVASMPAINYLESNLADPSTSL